MTQGKLKKWLRVVALCVGCSLGTTAFGQTEEVPPPPPPPRPRPALLPVMPTLRGDTSVSRARDEQPPANMNSVLRGRVLYADTQRPVSRAQVRLECEEKRDLGRATATDRNGEFVVSGLGACEYIVSAMAPGALSRVVVAAFSPESQEETAVKADDAALKNLTVTLSGTDSRDITIPLAHGGAIAGRILYADGEPVTFARLTLFRQTKQGLMPFGVSEARTDDRGDYRLEEVPPGQYAVGVVDTISTSVGRGVVTVYHPAATNAQDATIITVTAGGEATNVNLQVPLAGLRRAGGVVKWKRTGLPVANTEVILRRRDEKHLTRTSREVRESLSARAGDNPEVARLVGQAARGDEGNNAFPARTDEEGRWSAGDLPAGEYRLEITASLPAEPRAAERAPEAPANTDPFEEVARYGNNSVVRHYQDVSLRDTDAEDIAIEVGEGSTLAGIILNAGGGPPEQPAMVLATVTMEDGNSHTAQTFSRRDGTFQVRGLPPGQARLRIELMRQEGLGYVRSITLGGVEVTNQPLTVPANTVINGLQVRLGNESGTIQGRVRNSDGQPAAGIMVVAVGLTEDGTPGNGSFANALTDADGNFSVKVRPGGYVVLAAPERLARVRDDWFRDAPRVNAVTGQTVTVELTLKPRQE